MVRTSVIGLDIGSTAVRAAELRFDSGRKGTPFLSGFAQVPLAPGAVRDGEVVETDVVSVAIKKVRELGKFTAKDVVMGVGNQRVIVREADLPWQPLDQLKKTLPYHAEQLLPTAVTDAVFDFVPTGEFQADDSRMVSGLFVAAIRDMVMANANAVHNGGFSPVMVDLNAFAVQRALGQGDLKNYTVAFVDVGARITNLVIAERGVPRFVRVLPHGGLEGTDAVANTMSINREDAERVKRQIGVGVPAPPELASAADALMNTTTNLIEAVRSTFVYYSSKGLGAPIDVVVLTGGGIMLNGFGQYLASAVRLPVQIGNPFEHVHVEKGVNLSAIQGQEHVATVAVGLAYGSVL